jgi:menaquinone-dependent protoporphyrinogen IX oxidase
VGGAHKGPLCLHRCQAAPLWSLFIRRAGGPHDLSRDYDFTDWDAVRREAHQFLTDVAQPLVTAS